MSACTERYTSVLLDENRRFSWKNSSLSVKITTILAPTRPVRRAAPRARIIRISPRRRIAPRPISPAAVLPARPLPKLPEAPAQSVPAPRPRRPRNTPQGEGQAPHQQRRGRKPQKNNNAPHYEMTPAIPMHICPLGGLGEVGKNITLYECQGDMILVDCGLVFPDADMFGVDLVIPDFTYVLENKDRIKGLFITHGHEDHIGSLPYLLKKFNVPIYAARLTIGLIKNKLEEHGLASSAVFHEIRPRQKVKLGCFTVEPIHVNHSIPDALAFAIECPAGVVIHTGDFKVDYTPLSGDAVTDLSTIAEYGRKGVLALLSDSTNAERPGFTATEQTVAEGVRGLFGKAGKRRIIVATFASNIYRVQQIIDLAIESGRKVAVSGRSMVSNTEMARELGYLHAPDNVLIPIEEINKYPPEKVVLITTGSQGEPLSALSRMAQRQPPSGQGRPQRLYHHLGPSHPRQRKDRYQGRQRPAGPGRRGHLREHVRHPCFGPRLPGRTEAYADPGAPAVLPARAR